MLNEQIIYLCHLVITSLNYCYEFTSYSFTTWNRRAILSGIPAYKIVYTFADLGAPLVQLFESMNIWVVQGDKIYTISYSAPESEFSNHLQTIQNMIDSFVIKDNN